MRLAISGLLVLSAVSAFAQEPPIEEPEIFEVVEIAPELIGGVGYLHGRVNVPPGDPVEGEVMVTFIVNERGEVQEARALECELERVWCEAAVRAAEESQFKPGHSGGRRPERYRFTLPVQFTLPDFTPRFTMIELASRVTTHRMIQVRPVLIGGRADLQQRAILPPEAIEHGVRGRVQVGMTVGTDGIARDFYVAPGIRRDGLTPDQEAAARKIERNALDALAGSRFEPGTEDGVPVPMGIYLVIDFNLDR